MARPRFRRVGILVPKADAILRPECYINFVVERYVIARHVRLVGVNAHIAVVERHAKLPSNATREMHHDALGVQYLARRDRVDVDVASRARASYQPVRNADFLARHPGAT